MQDSKTSVYNRMLSTISELPPSFVSEASAAIQKKLFLMHEFRTAIRVGLYATRGNEVKTDLIFLSADKARKELYYFVPDNGRFAFYRVRDLSELSFDKDGLLAPPPTRQCLRDVDMLDIVIVPGIAFDCQGARLGFGRGRYDLCLDCFSGERIGLAYDFQVQNELPAGIKKQRVDFIITESRTIKCEKGR